VIRRTLRSILTRLFGEDSVNPVNGQEAAALRRSSD
jgi:hypothetical protein